jgi:hypothetical protein
MVALPARLHSSARSIRQIAVQQLSLLDVRAISTHGTSAVRAITARRPRKRCKFMHHSSIYAGAAEDPAAASGRNHF